MTNLRAPASNSPVLRRGTGAAARGFGKTVRMRRVPFAQLPREASVALTDAATFREFAAGVEVFGEGQPAQSLYLVSSGRAVARQQLNADIRLTVNVLGPGEMFGEMGLFTDATVRTAAVVAIEELKTFELGASDFKRLRAQHPSISDLFLRLLSDRSALLLRRLTDGQYLERSVRAARRLLEVADMATSGDAPTSVPLVAHDVAGLTGIFLDRIDEVLQELQSQGLIAVHQDSIDLLDVSQLRRHAGW